MKSLETFYPKKTIFISLLSTQKGQHYKSFVDPRSHLSKNLVAPKISSWKSLINPSFGSWSTQKRTSLETFCRLEGTSFEVIFLKIFSQPSEYLSKKGKQDNNYQQKSNLTQEILFRITKVFLQHDYSNESLLRTRRL